MWLHRSQHNYRQANPQAWLVQLTRRDEFYRYQFWSDYRWGALVMGFTGSSLYRLPVVHVPVKKPLQWLPVISPVDPGTSTRGLSTGGTVGVPVPVMFLWSFQESPPSVVPVISPVLILEPPPEAFPLVGLLGVPVPVCTDYRWVLFLWRNPFSGCQWSPLFWFWNLHQRPFHWWDCWGTGSSHVPVKLSRNPPSVVSIDQPCVDTGTSTRGLSTGVTVGGTGSSLVQTTGAAAQRVHLPEVAVTIETLISPVQIFGPVPVLFRLPVGSLASLCWGIPAPVLLRLPVVVTKIQQGLPVSQDYRFSQSCWWWNTAGLLVTENCRFRNRNDAGSGTGVMPVTGCWLQRNLLFPSLLARHQLQIQCWQQVHRLQGFPVTENWGWQVSWTGSFFSKFL